MTLPVNIDSTYADSGTDASVKAHQQHHDAIHAFVNGAGGVPVVRAFSFDHATPNLATGAPMYVPTPGDLLLDAWIQVDTPWNGTNTFADILPSPTAAGGLFATAGGSAPQALTVEMDEDYEARLTGSAVLLPTSVVKLSVVDTLGQIFRTMDVATTTVNFKDAAAVLGNTNALLPIKFTTDDAVCILVSQGGGISGGDSAATVGAATLYLETVTPLG